MSIIAYLIGSAVGVVFGIIFARRYLLNGRAGAIHFYDSEPGEPPIATAEFYEPIEEVRHREFVILDVSQK